jgi:hypothetical protein
MSLLNRELEGFLCSPSRLRALNDEDLVVALRSGCNDALAILFERHSALVLQRVRAILQDDSAADEIVRKVFLDFYRTVNQFSPSAVHLQARLLQCAYPRIMRLGKDLRELESSEFDHSIRKEEHALSYGIGSGRTACNVVESFCQEFKAAQAAAKPS